MSLLRGEKKRWLMDVMSTAVKGIHAQASCFMYVDFLIVYDNIYPIKEQQGIADALYC